MDWPENSERRMLEFPGGVQELEAIRSRLSLSWRIHASLKRGMEVANSNTVLLCDAKSGMKHRSQ